MEAYSTTAAAGIYREERTPTERQSDGVERYAVDESQRSVMETASRTLQPLEKCLRSFCQVAGWWHLEENFCWDESRSWYGESQYWFDSRHQTHGVDGYCWQQLAWRSGLWHEGHPRVYSGTRGDCRDSSQKQYKTAVWPTAGPMSTAATWDITPSGIPKTKKYQGLPRLCWGSLRFYSMNNWWLK